MTSRGFVEEDMRLVANLIYKTLMNPENDAILDEVRSEVRRLTETHPLY